MPSGEIDLRGAPLYLRVVRLTNEQWARAVQDLLRLPAASGLEKSFASAVRGTTSFTNNELVLDVTPRSSADFQAAAEVLAAEATASDEALARVYAGTDEAGFIATFGRRVYRRPLTPAEIDRYQAMFTTGSMMNGSSSAFAKGAALVISTMLQSPHFLYRTELGPADAPLSGYEMAAKLSLGLRDTTPDDALLDLAATPGKLETTEGALETASQMLAEPSAAAVMRRFHSELLRLDRLAAISKVNETGFEPTLNAEYEESSYLFFDKAFTRGLGLREILTSTTGFVGPGMAAIYGVAAPASGFVERDLGPRRVGYFSQLPFLSLYGIDAEPPSIGRGIDINLSVLCATLPSASSVLPPLPPARRADQTNREWITSLTAGCTDGCHSTYIDPLGFAFEHFDGIGRYREIDSGKPINSSGSYPFAEGPRSFSDHAELMNIIAGGRQAHACYAKNLAGFALQRDIVAGDLPLVNALRASSMASGASIKQVLLELVRNPAFRTRAGGLP
jgi:hypothetical protein